MSVGDASTDRGAASFAAGRDLTKLGAVSGFGHPDIRWRHADGSTILLLSITIPALADDVVSGSIRIRIEDWHWFETPAAEDDYTFLGAQLRVAAKKKFGAIEGQLEVATPLLLNLPREDATSPHEEPPVPAASSRRTGPARAPTPAVRGSPSSSRLR